MIILLEKFGCLKVRISEKCRFKNHGDISEKQFFFAYICQTLKHNYKNERIINKI
jgi:hypothetical protein